MEGLQQYQQSSSRDDSYNNESAAIGKRVRRELRPMKSMNTLAAQASAASVQKTQGSGSSTSNSNDYDVGKALGE